MQSSTRFRSKIFVAGEIVRIRSATINEDIRGDLASGKIDRLDLEWWLGAQRAQSACGLISTSGDRAWWRGFGPGVFDETDSLSLGINAPPVSTAEVSWGKSGEIVLIERSEHVWFRRTSNRVRPPKQIDVQLFRNRFLASPVGIEGIASQGLQLFRPALKGKLFDLVYPPHSGGAPSAERTLCFEVDFSGRAQPVSLADFGPPLPSRWSPKSEPAAWATIFGVSQRTALARERASQAFDDALEKLFEVLMEEGIFGINVDNTAGFSPGDHGVVAAYEKIPEWFFNEYDPDESGRFPICWTDTKFYRTEARARTYDEMGCLTNIDDDDIGNGEVLPLSSAQVSGCIYYSAESENELIRVASRICEIAPLAGLVAEWNGQSNTAVAVDLAGYESGQRYKPVRRATLPTKRKRGLSDGPVESPVEALLQAVRSEIGNADAPRELQLLACLLCLTASPPSLCSLSDGSRLVIAANWKSYEYDVFQVAECRATPKHLLETLFILGTGGIKAALARNESVPTDVLARLSLSPDRLVRRSLAWNPRISQDLILRLANDRNTLVRLAVSENETAALELRADVAGGYLSLLRSMDAQMTSTAERSRFLDVASRLEETGTDALGSDDIRWLNDAEVGASGPLKAMVARMPQAPPDLLEGALNSRDVSVLEALAANQQLPVHIATSLARKRRKEIRTALAANPKTPPQLRVSLIRWLARHEEASCRRSAAGNPASPLDILKGLSNDDDPSVRSAVAENEIAPMRLRLDLIERLAASPLESCRAYAGGNTAAPEAVLRSLAEDESESVKCRVALNPATPPELLRKLVSELDMIPYPDTPPHLLDLMALSLTVPEDVEQEAVRIVAADEVDASRRRAIHWLTAPGRPQSLRALGLALEECPSALLTERAQSVFWEERCAVAMNPSTPRTSLEELASDVEPVVREAAVATIARL